METRPTVSATISTNKTHKYKVEISNMPPITSFFSASVGLPDDVTIERTVNIKYGWNRVKVVIYAVDAANAKKSNFVDSFVVGLPKVGNCARVSTVQNSCIVWRVCATNVNITIKAKVVK